MVFAYIIYIIVGGNVTAYPCAVNKETRSDGEIGKRTGFKLLQAENAFEGSIPSRTTNYKCSQTLFQ